MELPVIEKERKTPEQIAKDALAKIEKDKESVIAKAEAATKEAESKGAAPAAKADEQKKTEDTEVKAEEGAEPKEDDLLKAKEGKTGDKVANRKAEIQKEIDALIAQKKSLENEVGDVSQVKAKLQQLEKEMSEIKKPKQEEDTTTLLKKAEQDRIAKYMSDDAEKPRAERREMTDDDLDEWYLEDPKSAARWVARQELRRDREREEDKAKTGARNQAEVFISKQNQARERLIAKYPQVNVANRAKELMSQGKTAAEVHNLLMAENKHYRLCHEIATSDPKYIESENGPELVMQEMEKRLTDSTGTSKTYTAEEVEQIRKEAAEAERARLSGVDVGVSSTRGKVAPKTVSDFEKRQLEIAKKAGMTEEKLNKAREYRRGILGADKFNDEE